MGYSVKSIPFFSDAIELDVHTATYAQDLGHTALCHFANGSPLRLEQVEETGEYIATRTRDGAFIHGAEI
jgi:hypothetical protein